jgi:hypothetical protein
VAAGSHGLATISGSTAINQMAILIIQSNLNEFYKLVYP